MHDQLRDEAVVVGRHLVALIKRAVDAYAEPARRMVFADAAGRRAEIGRALGVDAAFDGVAAEAHIALADRERHAGGDAQLLADHIDAADHLADRMLDLQPRVHLNEIERPVLVQKLHCSRAAVAELLQGGAGDTGQPLARRAVERRRRAFFEDFLM